MFRSGTSRLRTTTLICAGLAGLGAGAAQAATDEEIVICAIDDTTGNLAAMSTPKTWGYALAVEEINAEGGIMVDGAEKTLRLAQYDGQSDVGRYGQLTQQCIYEDEADVVMAGYTGAEREAARVEAVRNETIFWHNNQGEGGIADRYSFFSGPTPEQQVLPALEWMIGEFGPRMTFIGADYNFCRAIGAWVRTAAGLYGGDLVLEEYFPFDVNQWQQTIGDIQGVDPDFQVHCLVGGDHVQFYPQADAAGLKTPVWSNVTISDGYEHKIFPPPQLENMHVPPGYIEDVPGEASESFVQKIRERHPDAPYVNEHAAFGYVAVKAMAKAWAAAGTTETEAVIDALEAGVTVEDAPGGFWSLAGDQHHAAMPTYLFRVEADHSLALIKELGVTEPTFLKDIGVDVRELGSGEGETYLPTDNPAWAKFFSQ
ncbi:ABC transporter substrate-binding protein [Defluviimonas sp. SAOS-178_SWC]|uniref:ABC transporter substrate-binding protein n=1 Tax=Defluviimonas sp. SAOS-178_SWC TaxID=3121287 RepID=UPI0032217F31